MTWYGVAKLAHLAALLVWIGPPLGAYALLVAAWRARDRERIAWVERQVERVLVAEHVAFPLVIATGLWMMALLGFDAALSASWLQMKLAVVAAIVGFEVFDIWISHTVTARVWASDAPFDHAEYPRARRLRRRLAAAAVVVGGVLIPAAVALAVLKPA